MSGTPLLRFWQRGIATLAVFVTAVTALSACGGGGSSGGANTSGTVVIGLTDAEGDFLAYAVDVVSLTLTKADGSAIETLPVRTRVDFAQYVEMTEFVTAATIPSGVYTGALLRLDYTGADVRVENASGDAMTASMRDAHNNPVTTLDLSVRFDSQRHLVIRPGVPAHLTLDFNLAASNHVDLSGATPVVTVLPFLVAEVEPETPKIHRVRGPLKGVDTAGNSFEVFIRPFHRLSGNYGALTVATDNNTVFEINGSGYQGAAGVAALAAQPALTAVIALGDLNLATRRFVAQEVYGGSSVPYGTNDVVTGAVVARSGAVLTVRGAVLLRADGSIAFRETVAVTVGPATRITKQLSPGTAVDHEAISVGSRVSVFGSANTDGSALDATQGLARLLISTLTATVNSMAGSELEIALQTLNGRRVALYNFAGTGSSGATNADPAHYQVEAGPLSLSGINTGTPVRVRGFVQAFGQAPADFYAHTLIDVSQLSSHLLYAWNPATATPFVSRSASAVVLNPSSGMWHHMVRGGVFTDVGGGITAAPLHAHGLYAIGHQGTVQLYLDFDTYQQALGQHLTSGQHARFLGGHGNFEDSTTTLRANRLFTAFE